MHCSEILKSNRLDWFYCKVTLMPVLLLFSPLYHPLLLLFLLVSPSSHSQTSGCVCGLSTWSMSRLFATACPQTSANLWSGSLSCSVRPTLCWDPGTWAPSCVTSSSQSWTTWTPSGQTTWVELCWRRSKECSSQTPWGAPRAARACDCSSVWIRTTTSRAGGCCWPTHYRLRTAHALCPPAHRLTRPGRHRTSLMLTV